MESTPGFPFITLLTILSLVLETQYIGCCASKKNWKCCGKTHEWLASPLLTSGVLWIITHILTATTAGSMEITSLCLLLPSLSWVFERCCLGDGRSPALQSTQSYYTPSACKCWVTSGNICRDLCPCDIPTWLCRSRVCWWCLQTREGQLHRTPSWMNLMKRISKWSLTPWRSSPMNTSGEALCVVHALGKFFWSSVILKA